MKVSFFEKIYINVLGLIPSALSKKNKTNKELYFDEQFNNYLVVEEALFCYQMVDNGYKPHKNQKKQLDEILMKKIINNEYDYKEIMSVNSLSTEIKLNALINAMPDKEVEYTHFKNKEYSEDCQQYLQDLKKVKEDFFNLFNKKMNLLKKSFKTAHDEDDSSNYIPDIEKTKNRVKEIKKLLYLTALSVHHETLTQVEINILKNQVKNTSSYLTNGIDKYYWNELFPILGKERLDRFGENISLMQKDYLSKDNRKEELLNQLKRINLTEETLVEDVKNLINKEQYSLQNLSIEAREKIENIQKLANKMDNEDVSNFVKERVPVILKKYFSIDEEYRSELKNVEGFNAQELMMQSLDNIERIVKAKQEDNNYDLLSELSIENRKLKVKV